MIISVSVKRVFGFLGRTVPVKLHDADDDRFNGSIGEIIVNGIHLKKTLKSHQPNRCNVENRMYVFKGYQNLLQSARLIKGVQNWANRELVGLKNGFDKLKLFVRHAVPGCALCLCMTKILV